jgi:TetR/AcrR family transcriptional regulator, mexJK operon transcriptional repressor
MQLRRMVIGESGRFPELGAALFREGPGRAIDRLAEVFTHYAATGELAISDPHGSPPGSSTGC